MKVRYKLALTFIVILLALATYIEVDYNHALKSKVKVSNNSLVFVDENLSINFLDGKEISGDGVIKTHFSITNTKDEKAYYYINFMDVKNDGEDITFSLNTDDLGLNKDYEILKIGNNIIGSYIELPPLSTHSYNLFINNANNFSMRLDVGYETFLEKTLSSLIMESHEIKDPTTKPGNEIAITDESLIKEIDNDGITYIFRGNVNNNYFKLGELLFRIVRINGDGSIRVVLDNEIPESVYYESEDKTDISFNNSKIYNSLKEWYQQNLITYDDYLSESKFCSDETSTIYNDVLRYYSGNSRNMIDLSPTLICLSDPIVSKVGLLNADEVLFAGAVRDIENSEYYLYNKNITNDTYTMTPAYQKNGYFANIITMTPNGSISNETNGENNIKIRPVVNLIKNIKVTGSGTLTDPYIIPN